MQGRRNEVVVGSHVGIILIDGACTAVPLPAATVIIGVNLRELSAHGILCEVGDVWDFEHIEQLHAHHGALVALSVGIVSHHLVTIDCALQTWVVIDIGQCRARSHILEGRDHLTVAQQFYLRHVVRHVLATDVLRRGSERDGGYGFFCIGGHRQVAHGSRSGQDSLFHQQIIYPDR